MDTQIIFSIKFFYQFMNSRQTNLNQTQPTSKENITVEIPYVRKQSHIFAKDISKLIWKFSAVHLTPIYKTCKVGNYFNLKSNIWCCRLYCSDSNSVIDNFLLLKFTIELGLLFAKLETISI